METISNTNPNETRRETVAQLLLLAAVYDTGDAARIQHFVKVHDFAATIGTLEHLDAETMYILESAAILHDIGIHVCEAKYGSCSGHYQEIEGPAIAEELLQQTGSYTQQETERIKYLIAHHHTYTDIEGMDYQILVEADFLVNLQEDAAAARAIASAREHIFRTGTGLRLLNAVFQTAL